MAKYDLLTTEYSKLSDKDKYAYLVDYKSIMQAAFGENSNAQRLFTHMALLNMYKNNVQQALLDRLQRDIDVYVKQLFEVLERYLLEQNGLAEEDVDLATKLSYIVFEYKTGEDLPDFCEELYDEHFVDEEPCEDEWALLDWLSGLVLQIALIDGHKLDEDIAQLYEDKTNIDLFYCIEDLLENLAACIVDQQQIKNYNDVYATEEHIAVVEKVRSVIADALKASRPFEEAFAKYKDAILVPQSAANTFFGN